MANRKRAAAYFRVRDLVRTDPGKMMQSRCCCARRWILALAGLNSGTEPPPPSTRPFKPKTESGHSDRRIPALPVMRSFAAAVHPSHQGRCALRVKV